MSIVSVAGDRNFERFLTVIELFGDKGTKAAAKELRDAATEFKKQADRVSRAQDLAPVLEKAKEDKQAASVALADASAKAQQIVETADAEAKKIRDDTRKYVSDEQKKLSARQNELGTAQKALADDMAALADKAAKLEALETKLAQREQKLAVAEANLNDKANAVKQVMAG